MAPPGRKRPSEWQEEAEETVDDLAHAATFAVMTFPPPVAPTKDEVPENLQEEDEIKIDDEEESSSSSDSIPFSVTSVVFMMSPFLVLIGKSPL